ncbi:MFS sugar transporter [Candidatus Francisella endociliophora]|uniref:Lysosomal dipeptide transporter MFSD1 n=1 Tax=Candidatus Francisella endociliophora TaxID=653937 RepID=A0A097EPC5_9GAMM|nr:MFS transporter [Francisella sp. FSC1006]AIT09421.1 MFS sugar transporter [Francisella sp. FSC1006]
MQKVTKAGFTIWFLCAFFYALEFIIRASGNSLYDSFSATPYNLSSTEIGVFSSAFYWAYVASQLPAGILVDKFGVKRIMLVSTFMFSIGVFIATQATSQQYLILYRILAGVGGGFAFLCALKSIAIWLPKRSFPLFTGATQMLMYGAGTLTGLPLVILADRFSIPVIMSVILIFSILLFIAVIFFIPFKEPHNQKDTDELADTHTKIEDIPIVFKIKQILLNGFFCFTIYGTTALFADLWSYRFLSLDGYADQYAGLASSMIFIGIAIFSPIWGVVATVLNKQKALLTIASIFGLFIVTAIVYLHLNPILMCALCVLWGGMQAVHVLNFTILRTHISPMYIATGIAMVNLFIPLSGAVLQPFVGFMVSLLTDQGLQQLEAFKYALFILPILMLLSIILSLFIKEKKA